LGALWSRQARRSTPGFAEPQIWASLFATKYLTKSPSDTKSKWRAKFRVICKGFLISKLFEEALEVREAAESAQKVEELADLFEVFRALANAENITLDAIERAADDKKRKSGGFEKGLVLLQTAILASDRAASTDWERAVGDVLTIQTSDDTAEIPFLFLGFMEIDQPRSIFFEQLGVRLELRLRPDRLEVRLTRDSEQLGLPLENWSRLDSLGLISDQTQ
jgi:predicted house-cleaning noncanonical NTP pyrophosphatase (MazG superfamily)